MAGSWSVVTNQAKLVYCPACLNRSPRARQAASGSGLLPFLLLSYICSTHGVPPKDRSPVRQFEVGHIEVKAQTMGA